MLPEIKFGATIALILVSASFCQQVNADENQTINCYTCASTDTDCLSEPTKLGPKECATGKCFTKSDAGKISRGCLAEGVTCDNAAGCYQCTTEKCNSNLICKNCASSSDPDCSQTEATKESYNSVCSQKQTSCISLVRDDKHLERRCAKENEKCPNETTCSICTGANCNVGIFPSNRIRCYQCPATETKCSDVIANSETIKSKPCLLYNDKDQCFTFGTSATTMTRGCVSDTDTNVNKCSQPDSSEACGVCAMDNCNNLTYQRDQLLKCVQCNSSSDANCQYNKKAEDAVNCKEKILYSQSDSCYMETLKDKSVIRGCLYDRPVADGACKAPDCNTCNSGDGCNFQDNSTFTCIRCRSDLKPKCINDAKDMGGECRNKDLTDTNKECFTGTWNKVVIRGCMVDADARQQVECANKNNIQCSSCLGKDCNNARASASKTDVNIKIASSLLALIALFFWRLH